jgi:hypothetical protein
MNPFNLIGKGEVTGKYKGEAIPMEGQIGREGSRLPGFLDSR